MKKQNITILLLYIVSAELIGALSALFVGNFSDFFITHIKPPLLPPAWLFPVVWSVLYAGMGVSAYLVYRTAKKNNDSRKKAMTVYWIQLFLNFAWSILFFGWEALWLAVIDIVILFAMIIVMIVQFQKIRPAAGYLQIPYLLWVLFASYLNIATAMLN